MIISKTDIIDTETKFNKFLSYYFRELLNGNPHPRYESWKGIAAVKKNVVTYKMFQVIDTGIDEAKVPLAMLKRVDIYEESPGHIGLAFQLRNINAIPKKYRAGMFLQYPEFVVKHFNDKQA